MFLLLASSKPTFSSPFSTFNLKYLRWVMMSVCSEAKLSAVSSVSVAISFSVFAMAARFVPKDSTAGTPVPTETRHCIWGSRGPAFHSLLASSHSWRIGLFAPVAPSRKIWLFCPILIDSKNEDAAEVARLTSQILALL
jgi:hypothetical protein